ncbi:spermidine/putrescine ABC transporter ATP-binding protein PotA [Candidatus Purcelliella pentastirinorum]|uniref:spermidine/putrescine ABC transporter ATP-binding protein PotA n=1 Tax=Candidatus Purcelliella pentastirinorum TaxID=472834 RepID=UPI002368C3A1|nr:spermidine/putrescine ABC transporter ATP-binding protein PotA [Candidatus Purcelliella pentastirinorum]WDI78772.1 spermidine/putrescine ABC transporter ATP-binding protein PotA [Candidatus Purcelliella pentastirinorum]WDR79906.1 spermidine/putrescine ABC transporter ATP-binding protein PotA [Candidatus Purcelliella pentastirinorum]
MIKKNSKKILMKLVNINKLYKKKKIITNFNMNIYYGEFLTILGPSGCGKTTILRLISGLEKANTGNIFLNNKNITNTPAENRNINTVFQNYALFPHMSVFENIAFGLKMQKITKKQIIKRVNESLSMVQLENFKKRYPNQLSGGEQQRVAIARAVINRPKILLLDEPLSALDYKLKKKMQNKLKYLQRELKITFILVTHDQEEALSISDRILVIKNGHIEQEGTPREIYEKPNNIFVAKFIGEINIFNTEVLKIINKKKIMVEIDGKFFILKIKFKAIIGQKIHILLRPEDLRVEEINNKQKTNKLIGYVRERNYKGMTLESTVELENGKIITVSEFFNEDDPNVDHNLNQKMAVSWVKNWEVILPYENKK